MRSHSIILALVAVLVCARQAGAEDYCVTVGGQRIGFIDFYDPVNIVNMHVMDDEVVRSTFLCLEPIGVVEVPFTAFQGMVGSCLLLAMLLLALVAAVWERRRTIR